MWNSISRFFGNLTGGAIGESDEERRRKQQQQQKAAATAAAAPKQQPQQQVLRPGGQQQIGQSRPLFNSVQKQNAPVAQDKPKSLFQSVIKPAEDDSLQEKIRVQRESEARVQRQKETDKALLEVKAPGGRSVGSLIEEYDKSGDSKKRTAYRNMAQKAAADENDPEHEIGKILSSRLKLNAGESIRDFVAGSNEALLGGAVRNTANAFNMVGSGFNRDEADKRTYDFMRSTGQIDKDGRAKITRDADKGSEAFKSGTTTGNVQRIAADVATMVLPGVAAERAISAVPAVAQWLERGNLATRAVKAAGPAAGGGIVSSAVAQAQNPGQNAGENFGVGVLTDIAAGAAGPVVSRIFTKLRQGQRLNQVEERKLTQAAQELQVRKVDPQVEAPAQRPVEPVQQPRPDLNPGQRPVLNELTVEPVPAMNVGEQLPARQAEAVQPVQELEQVIPPQPARNNLFEGQDARERFANPRDLGESQAQREVADRQELASRISQLPDDNYVTQMADRFKMNPDTIRRLMQQTNKTDLFEKLNGNADNILNARNSDAYATSIINEATEQGRLAAMRAGVDTPTSRAIETPEQAITREVDELTPTISPDSDVPGNIDGVAARGIERLADNTLTSEQRATVASEVAEEFTSNLDVALRNTGSSTEEFTSKLAQIRRGDADESILTDAERQINEVYQSEMSQLVGNAEEMSGAVIGRQGDGFYSPEQRAGATQSNEIKTLQSMFEGGGDSGFAQRNTRAIGIDELDYSGVPIQNYVGEMLTYGRKETQAVYEALARQAPEATPEMLQAATRQQVAMINEVNSKSRDWSGKVINSEGDLADAMTEIKNTAKNAKVLERSSQIGKSLGIIQDEINVRPKGLTDQQKLESVVLPDGNTLFNKLGFEDWADADAIAGTQVRRNADQLDLAKEVDEYVKGHYPDVVNDDKRAALMKLGRDLQDLPDIADGKALQELQQVMVTRTYQNLAKSQMLNAMQMIDVKNNGFARMIDDHASDLLTSGTMRKTAATRINNTVKNFMNQAVRSGNISSAINEMSDVAKTKFVYGRGNGASMMTPTQGNEMLKKYGMADISTRTDAGALDEKSFSDAVSKAMNSEGILDNKVVEQIFKKQGKGTADTLESGQILPAVQFYRYVEMAKGGAFLKNAENFYSSQGLQGDELTKAVLSDYRQVMLPVDRFQKTFFDKLGAFGQYGSWGIRNMQFNKRAYTGTLKGNLAEKRAVDAFKAYAPRQLGFWLGANTLKGTSLVGALGLTDYTGITGGDFSQISDKNMSDEAIALIGGNTGIAGGLLADLYLAGRSDDLYGDGEKKEQYFDTQRAIDRATGGDDITQSRIATTLVPTGTATARTIKAAEEQNRGYVQNKNGRITYQTPDNPLEAAQGIAFGNRSTTAGREYSGSENAIQRMAKGDNVGQALKSQFVTDSTVDNIVKLFNGNGTREYNRPLTGTSYDRAGYSDLAKQAYDDARKKHGKNSKESREVLSAWLKDGRQFNKLYDDLQRNKPEVFKAWVDSKDGDVLTPEKWKTYGASEELYQYEKNRKLLEKKHLGRSIDPIYELSDDKAKAVMQQRAAHTGDDMKLAALMYKSDWYKPFKDAESKYYSTFTGDKNTDGKSNRYKDWTNLSTELNSDEGVKSRYELVKANQELYANNAKDSDTVKAWWKANSDAYNEQKKAYDNERFTIVNKMRALEGVEPLTEAEFFAKIKDADEDNSKSYTSYSKSGSRSGGRRGGRNRGGSGGSDSGNRAYIADTMTNFGDSATAIKRPKLPAKELEDVRKVVKQPRRATKKANIRITI